MNFWGIVEPEYSEKLSFTWGVKETLKIVEQKPICFSYRSVILELFAMYHSVLKLCCNLKKMYEIQQHNIIRTRH